VLIGRREYEDLLRWFVVHCLIERHHERSSKMRLLRRQGISFVTLLAMWLLLSSGVAGAADLNPPLPPDATEVHCSTNPHGTVCHYTRARAGSNLPNWNSVVCDGFTINFTFSSVARIKAVYDAAGNLVKEVAHIGFDGTLLNATDASKTVPYAGHWTRTRDFLAQTETITGLHQHVVLPGQGLVSVNVGRLVLDLDPAVLTPEFVAGQWDAFPGVPMDTQALCQALS
jgi:hypothetical protein